MHMHYFFIGFITLWCINHRMNKIIEQTFNENKALVVFVCFFLYIFISLFRVTKIIRKIIYLFLYSLLCEPGQNLIFEKSHLYWMKKILKCTFENHDGDCQHVFHKQKRSCWIAIWKFLFKQIHINRISVYQG